MKQRMSTADVSAEVACLRETVCGLRVANIYDVDARVGRRLLQHKSSR